MQRMILAAASAAALGLAAAPAMAQTAPASNVYGTLGYSYFDNRNGGLGAAQARLGYKFAPYFGVEAEGALGVDSHHQTYSSAPITVDTKVRRSIAAYAVATAPLGPQLDVFARLGYGETKFRYDSTGPVLPGFTPGRSDVTAESVNYGVGAQYFFDGANGLRADWTRYDYRDTDGKADVFGVSYVRRF